MRLPSITRRSFLGAASAAVTVPYVVPASALGLGGATAANERITMGLVGCGPHGAGWNLDQVFRCDDVQVVAVCDVDRGRLEAARHKVDDHYGRLVGGDYRGCFATGDFRELVRREDVDTVCNATPDHWHVLPSLMAARLNKDVICEKPLTLFVEEGRVLCEEVRQRELISQTASENRSIESYIDLCERVRNGRIGKLTHIEVTLPAGNEERGEHFSQRDEVPVPEGFDYATWLGQAPWAPYVPARCHGSFRWILDYSGGRLTDWGAHMIDLAQWGNGTDHTGPVEVEGHGEWPPRDALFNTAPHFDLLYHYADGVTMRVSSSAPGIRFEGTDGWIASRGWRGALDASDPSIVEEPIGSDEIRLYRPSEVVPRHVGSHGGEHRNFADCVKSRQECYAPFEIGHRTITIAHIGNIAMLLGRKLRWDPAAERFLDDDEANAMLTRKQRDPWTLAQVDSWL